MKEYKVEALIYYPNLTLDSGLILRESKEGIQAKLDEYTSRGYTLTSTSSSNVGSALYSVVCIYLFFEKDS